MSRIAPHHATPLDHRVYVASSHNDRQLVAGVIAANGHRRPTDREVASAWLALRVYGGQEQITVLDVVRAVLMRRDPSAPSGPEPVAALAQERLPV